MKTDMDKLSEVVNDRMQELNLYRAFVAEKGLAGEFAELLALAVAVKKKARGGEVETPFQLIQSKH